jgi:ABC-type multidrug transport system ATPase subunit
VAPALTLTGITKRLGGRPVLRGIDVEVAAGETVAVLGPNGSGKSTLLRVAAGQSRPDAGKAERQGPVSFLAQEAPLYAELTPAEHVRWWARLWRKPARQDDVHALLGEAGLLKLAHRLAGTLSRGERQRLALCLAFLADAPLLVLDEPFTGLDTVAHAWLESRLAARKAAGAATLISLHGEEAARRVADRVVHLTHGLAAESPSATKRGRA